MDEMAIHKGFDIKGGRVYGYVDIGGLIDNDEEEDRPAASSALVFLAVNIKENFRIPIAYFLINGLNASERANILDIVLHLLHDIDVSAHSITFDMTPVNFSMCEVLGAKFDFDGMKGKKNDKLFVPWFKHSAMGRYLKCQTPVTC